MLSECRRNLILSLSLCARHTFNITMCTRRQISWPETAICLSPSPHSVVAPIEEFTPNSNESFACKPLEGIWIPRDFHYSITQDWQYSVFRSSLWFWKRRHQLSWFIQSVFCIRLQVLSNTLITFLLNVDNLCVLLLTYYLLLRCRGDCSYEWNSDNTPEFTGVDPTSGRLFIPLPL